MISKIGKRGDGWTLSKGINIFLAVIGLAIIIFLYFAITNFNITQKEKNAGALLDNILAKAEILNEGEKNEFIFRGIKEWYLVGWSLEEGLAENKPDKCFGKSCLCVCETITGCDGAGVCKGIKEDEVRIESQLISPDGYNPPGTNEIKSGTFHLISSGSLYLRDDLFTLTIEKKENLLVFSKNEAGEKSFDEALEDLKNLERYWYIERDERNAREETREVIRNEDE